MWAWGYNVDGQLGDNTTTSRSTPVQVLGPGGTGTLSGVAAVAGGTDDSLAVKSDGSVWAWGANAFGELGDNTTTSRSTPVQVLGPGGTGTLSGVVAIAAGDEYSVAVKSDGSVWDWGLNEFGELGDNTKTDSSTPVQVLGPGGTGTLSGVAAIAAGADHSLALKSDGSVWAWGANAFGQLGDNTKTSRSTPVQVLGPGGTGTLSGVVAIAAGEDHSLAVKSDGSVWAWGYNVDGALGDNTTTNSSTPVQVLGPGGTGTLSGVVAVAAGSFYSLALKSDGSVWAWGSNPNGELGDDMPYNSSTPVQVLGPGGTGTLSAAALGTGCCGEHSLAISPTPVTPVVSQVNPSSGPAAGGTSVTITGTNLASASAVDFGTTAASITADGATSITVTSPTHSAATVDVTVTTAGGTSATSSADQFTYDPVPTVSGVSPNGGPTGGGTSVTITGTEFVSGATVSFGLISATGVTVVNGTQITATAPAGSAGTVNVTVSTPGGTSGTSSADLYTYDGAPTVTSITPSAGWTTGGTSVTITGTNLSGATAVDFGTTAATITADSATSITAISPAHAAGMVDVTVTTASGKSSTSSSDQFTYDSAPTVTAITPTAGPTAGATSVTITGTGFPGASAVKFGANAASFTIDSATHITATAPPGTGTVDVTVTTSGGTSATSPADQFSYISNPLGPVVPALSALSTTPRKFSTAGRLVAGRCVKPTKHSNARKHCRRAIKLKLSYTLNTPATVTITLKREAPGREVRGRCVKPTDKNRKHPRCMLLVALAGGIVKTAAAGANAFTWNGKLAGHTVGPGSYQLTATPTGGMRQTVTFRITG